MRAVASSANAAVKAARKLARARNRVETGRLLIESPTVAAEALDHLERLFVTDEGTRRHAGLVAAAEAAGVDVLRVPERILASITTLASPQGLVGVAHLERPSLEEALAGARLIVILMAAGEPGNVGTIVRTADAAGADAVVLADAAVEPGNPRTVRASAGSLFHLPVAVAPFDTVADACRERGLRLVAADVSGQQEHTQADLSAPSALVFGSEAHGLPSAVLAACDEVIRVPLYGRAESLNLAAAAAVVLYEAARQRSGAGAAT